MKFAFVLFFSFLTVGNYVIANNNTDSLRLIAQNTALPFEQRAKAYNLLSNEYSKSSLDTALFYANSSFDLSRENSDTLALSKALYNRGLAYYNFQNFKQAVDSFKESLFYVERTTNTELYLNVLTILGIGYLKVGDYENAISSLTECVSRSKENGFIKIQFRALNSLGNTYNSVADYSKALVTFIEALEVNKVLQDDYYQTILTNNIGNVYFYLSDYDKAIEYYYLSLEIAEKIENDYFIKSAYGNIGLIYKNLKQYSKAINHLNTALAYYNANNDQYNASLTINGLGLAYLNLEKKDSALLYFNRSLAIKRSIADSVGMALVYNNIGSLYINSNEDLAEINLLKALELSELYDDNYNKTNAYSSLGDLYIIRDEIIGLGYYENALKLAIEHRINDVVLQVYGKLYEFYKSKNQTRQSLAYFEKYTFLNDSLHSEESKLKIEEIETIYEVDKKDNEIILLQKDKELQETIRQKEKEEARFYMLLVLSMVGIIILVGVIIFIRNKQKQRDKISLLEKRGLKVETEMLRSQMNPHFIFNSLNSIQSFISESDTMGAERFLAKFAKLMRLILDNSRQPFTTLENEISTLSLYLELEKQRFDNRFNYSINIHDIDDEFTQIPPMIAQPYIENAILHGVSSLTEGEVLIDYQQDGDKIICTIDDNGIGRAKSSEIKDQSLNQKSSLGIKVTQERIELLSEEFKTPLSINIIDKQNTKGEPLGTKVIIEMPWKE